MKWDIDWLRKITFWEAISYLLLLGIAMPLKYIWHYPLAVSIVGAIHGALFVLFLGILAIVHFRYRWPFLRSCGLFIASLLPIIPFFLDSKIVDWSKEKVNPASPSQP